MVESHPLRSSLFIYEGFLSFLFFVPKKASQSDRFRVVLTGTADMSGSLAKAGAAEGRPRANLKLHGSCG
jgi:hypothetical protein